MLHQRTASVESTCTVLTCTSSEFQDFYNSNLSTEILSDDVVKNVIDVNREMLQAVEGRYRLDDLLLGMLMHAPHPLGQRYVAVALHIAHQKGGGAIVELAKAWMDHLFLPMLSVSKAAKTEPSGGQTPTIDTTMQHVEAASRSGQKSLRTKLYRCAITNTFDMARVQVLVAQGRGQEVPPGPQCRMEAAHIIPFALNDFNGAAVGGADVRDVVRTWDMLQSWTRIDIQALVGENINTPANAIYMTSDDHASFGRFQLYLDKDAYLGVPNKYMARMTRDAFRLSDGQASSDVQFRTLEESGVEPPNPDFLKVHAAFAKVLNLSGAAEHFEGAERDIELRATLCLNGETDFGLLLASRLALMVY